MKFTYDLTVDDVIIFNNYHLNQQPVFKRKQNRRRFLIGSLYMLIGLFIFMTNADFWPFAWMLGLIGVMWALFYPRVVEYRVARTIQKSFKKRERPDAIPHELEIRSDGVQAKNDVDEGLIPWESILKVVTRPAAIYLYLNKENAIIIPKDALNDPAPSWEALTKAVEGYYYK